MIPRQPSSTLFPYTTLFRSEGILERADRASRDWRRRPVAERAERLRAAARLLRERKDAYARTMALEMGKPLAQGAARSEEHTSELQSHSDLVCRLLLEKKKQ